MTKIYYFSGTGNTYWSAKKLAERIGDAEVISISREIKQSEIRIETDAAVLLFPAYAYGMPGMVRRFLERAIIRADYLAAFVSYGTSPGGALGEVRRVLERKKLTLNYGGNIPAVENYLPMFGAPRVRVREKWFALQTAATEQAATAIVSRANNKVLTFRPLSRLISALFRCVCPKMGSLYRISADCNACGLCAQICPAGAIKMTPHGPEFQSVCEQCQACLNFCPQKALAFGRLRPNTERYHHPEVTMGELFSFLPT
jgi:ferredoxin